MKTRIGTIIAALAILTLSLAFASPKTEVPSKESKSAVEPRNSDPAGGLVLEDPK